MTLDRVFRRFAGDNLARLVQLYAAKGLQAATPLVVTLLVAKVLGPAEFGRYAGSQAVAVLAAMFIELGFNLSATRQAILDPGRARSLAHDVVTLKLHLSLVLILVFAVSWSCNLWPDRRYALPAALYAVGFGNSLFWYGLATRRTQAIALAEGLAAVFVLCALAIWTLRGGSGPLALTLVALGPCLSSVLTGLFCKLSFPLTRAFRPTPIYLLRRDFTAFFYRLTNASYNNLLILVLPYVAPATEVGVVALGLRLSAIMTQAVTPAHQMVITESQRRKTNPARRFTSFWSAQATALLAIAIAVFLSALLWSPIIYRLGSGYAEHRLAIQMVLCSAISAILLQNSSISRFIVAGEFGLSGAMFGILAIVLATMTAVTYPITGIKGPLLSKIALELVAASLVILPVLREGRRIGDVLRAVRRRRGR